MRRGWRIDSKIFTAVSTAGAYRALPSKRIHIPKANGKLRPVGIAALEDKIVQSAVVTVQKWTERMLGGVLIEIENRKKLRDEAYEREWEETHGRVMGKLE